MFYSHRFGAFMSWPRRTVGMSCVGCLPFFQHPVQRFVSRLARFVWTLSKKLMFPSYDVIGDHPFRGQAV